MNIIVLAGGLSPERNVSLSSGSLISAALRRKGHKTLMLDVYEGIADVPSVVIFLFVLSSQFLDFCFIFYMMSKSKEFAALFCINSFTCRLYSLVGICHILMFRRKQGGVWLVMLSCSP